MFNVSEDFKTYVKKPDRTFDTKVKINDVTYLSSDIIVLNIDESITSDDTLKIGEVVASQLDITLKSSVVVPVNAKIEVFICILCGSFYSEWVPLGTFYVDTRTVNRDLTSYVCYSDLIKTNQVYSTSLVFPETMINVLNDVAYILNLTLDSSVVINPSYVVSFLEPEITIHDILSYIASAHCASVYMTKDNKMAFKIFNNLAPIDTIITTEYFRLEPKNEIKTYTKIKCLNDIDGGFITSGTGDEDHTMEIENLYMNQAMLDLCVGILSGFSYIPFSMEWRGRGYVDVGDCYTIQNKESTIVTTILNNKMTYKNGLYGASYANSITKQKSEFNYSSNIRKSISRAGALLDSKPYYGVTFSKQYGIKIETSDNSSEAVFNADSLKFRGIDNDGVMTDRIYFDVPNRKYVFDGVLSAGTVEALSINADKGYIAEVTVDQIDTSTKISRYKNNDTSQFGYFIGKGITIDFINAYPSEPIDFEQAKNRNDVLLWWTNESETSITLENTGFPVMQYIYSEYVTLSMNFRTDPSTGFIYPITSYGAGYGGTDPDRGKGFVFKDSDEMVIMFKKLNGDFNSVRLGEDGITQLGNTGEIGLRNIAISDVQPSYPQMNDLWIGPVV